MGRDFVKPTLAGNRQCTLARAVSVEGVGYWSGEAVRVELCPAPENSGRYFVRTDVPHARPIAAHVAQRRDVPRRTVLGQRDAGIEMVEHVLAALSGLGIDNCEIRVSAGEMPGCDGSSRPFVEAIVRGGIVEQSAPAATLVVDRAFRVGDDQSWVKVRPASGPHLLIEYRLDYGPGTPIGRQSVELEITPESFRRELAASRTFLLQQEAEWLRSQGLGRAANWGDLLVFGPEGPIQNALRWPNECARHKALDLLGDLALAGVRLQGRISAHRSGHKLNAELVETLLARHEVSSAAREAVA